MKFLNGNPVCWQASGHGGPQGLKDFANAREDFAGPDFLKDPKNGPPPMSYSLNSLKGGYIGDYTWDYYKVIKGDTRSLDYSSYETITAMGRLGEK